MSLLESIAVSDGQLPDSRFQHEVARGIVGEPTRAAIRWSFLHQPMCGVVNVAGGAALAVGRYEQVSGRRVGVLARPNQAAIRVAKPRLTATTAQSIELTQLSRAVGKALEHE